MATADFRKELNFCTKIGLRVLGAVENMSGFVCPNCANCTDLFSPHGGRLMAEEFKVLFLGTVPIDPEFRMLIITGKTSRLMTTTVDTDTEQSTLLVEKYRTCSLASVIKIITDKVVDYTDSEQKSVEVIDSDPSIMHDTAVTAI